MKIAKRHLRRIIQEALEEADNPCWDGYRPGAQSGRKTKIGKSGKRVANCEKISETDSTLKEQEISGPDLTRGKDFSVGGSGEGKAAAMASYDEMYYDLVDDYYAWVDENGHITPSASSVMASYFLERGLEDDHKKHKMLSKAFAVSHDDIMADVRRQKSERSAMMGEARGVISKRQLRRIIRESVYGVGPGRGPSSVEEWTIWANTFGLDSEYDKEGQLIFYLDPADPDAQAIAREAERAGADVQTSPASHDSTIIYTGVDYLGRMGPRQMRMI